MVFFSLSLPCCASLMPSSATSMKLEDESRSGRRFSSFLQAAGADRPGFHKGRPVSGPDAANCFIRAALSADAFIGTDVSMSPPAREGGIKLTASKPRAS